MTLDEYREKYKNAKPVEKQQEDTKKDGVLDRYREKYGSSYGSKSQTLLTSFEKDFQDYATSAQESSKNMGYGTYDIAWKTHTPTAEKLQSEISNLKLHFASNKSTMDEAAYNKVIDYLDNAGNYLTKTSDYFSQNRQYFSQWDSEDDYNKYLQAQKDYENLVNFDTEAGAKEIDALNAEYEAFVRASDYDYTDNDSVMAYRDKMDDYETAINEKKLFLNRAKRTQEGIELASVSGNDDFSEYSGYTAGKERLIPDYDDVILDFVNGNRNENLAIGEAWGRISDNESSRLYATEYMTDDERAIYNYYYNKDGFEAAEHYLDSIMETLNYRKTTEEYKKLKGKPWAELAFGIAVGFDQANSGLTSLLNTEGEYVPQSSLQMASGMVREDLATFGPKTPDWMGGNSLGQMGYDTITTTSNMLPSILTSTVIGSINPVAGKIVGTAMMGASASGNAYQEMLNLGYDQNQARNYAALVGASEAGLEYLIGGISSLGGELTGNAVGKLLNNVDNAFARVAIQLGGSMASEFTEEYLQEVLTPWFQNLTLNTDNDIDLFSTEALYSGILGALTAGFMEGPGIVAENVNAYKQGKSLQKAGVTPGRLADIGGKFSADSVAYQLAGRVNENTGAYTMGRLFNEINATMTEQNIADIQENLVTKGMLESDASKLANAIAAVVTDPSSLTRKQAKALEANPVLAQAVIEEIIEPGSAIGTRLQSYSEILRSVMGETSQKPQEAAETTGEQIVAETQNVAQAQQVAAVEPETANDQQITGKLTGKESLPVAEESSVVEDGVTRQASTGKEVTPQKIVSIEGGKVMIQTDGGTIAADDIQFGTKETDLLWRSAADFRGINSAGANGIIRAYQSGTPVTTYLNGAAQEFQNGYYNMESGGEYADKLTPAQRAIIYELGQKAAGENIAREQAKAAAAKKQKATVSKTEKVGKVHFERNGRTFDQKRETALKTMEQLSKALDVEFYVYESYRNDAGQLVYKDANGNEVHAPNGFYDPSDGSIHIDLNAGADAKGTMLFTIAHELTHFIRQWSPAKFKVLANFLIKQYGENGVSVEKLVDAQIAKAAKNGRTIDYDTAFEEVVADSMEAIMTDGNVVQMMADLKQQDKTLWQKICDWFKDLVADLKALVDAYKGVKPDSAEGKMVADMQDVIVILESLYADALADASDNYQAGKAQKNTTREGGEKYQARRLSSSDLDAYLKAGSRNNKNKIDAINSGKKIILTSAQEIVDFIRNAITKKAGSATVAYGKVNDRLADEVLSESNGKIEITDNYLELIPDNLQHAYEQHNKAKEEGDIDLTQEDFERIPEYLDSYTEVLYAIRYSSGNVRICVSKKLDNGRILIIETVSKSRGSIQFKNAIGVSEEKYVNKYLNTYKKRAETNTRGSESSNNSLRDSFNSKNSIRTDDGIVKEKFSLREPVEQTKDLVAVHNLTEEKLIKSLRLGGLPMPSIAILRAQDGHSEFGDISLVFGRDTIDPQAYRTNKLYSGDAWTPTYPSVDYKVSEKVRKQISNKINSLVSSEVLRELGSLSLDSDNMTDTLNRYGGDVVDAFKSNEALKYAYLKDTGADIALPMKEQDLAYYGNVSNAAVRYFSGKFVNGLQTLEMYQNMGSRELMADKELTEAVADAYNWDVLRTMEPGSEEYLAYEQNPLFRADDMSFSEINQLLSATRKLFTSGVQQTVDTQAARKLIKDGVDQSAYEAWLKEVFSGIVEKEGIRNDKDYFTPSGNRRSFEALHYEHNLENVIKAMREKGDKGIGAFGGGSIFGAATTEFSSIEEMKQAGDRLQKIPEEEYQQMRDAFSNRFFELANSLPNNKNSFSSVDDAANMLVEAVSRYTTKSGMANYIRRESQGWATYSDYVVDDLIELVRDIRNMPTGYFEAKPRRAVGFDEVATAIVPNTVSDELKAKLEDMRIPFVEYAAGNEEARKMALNSLEGVKFSDRDSDGNELSQEQQEYFKDSKVRDEQGMLLAMYHGTPNGGFTKFRSGTYFTQNQSYADVYQNPGASSISTKKGAEAPMTYKVYLDIKKPFDTRNAKERRIFMQEFYRKYGTGTPLADSGLPDWVDGMDLQEFIEEMEYDYDGLILDEGGVGGYGDEVVSRGLSYVVFSPEQVKNVDNKTPTDDPDIRYSERDPELEKVNRVLAKENTELRHDVAYLKELLKLQKQVTGGTKFTKSSVEAAAGQLMKYADAKGNKAELAGLLNAVYEYIAGSKELTWDGVKEAAQPAVEWLQSHVRTRTERGVYAQDVLKEIRNSRIYLDETQKKEVAYQYGSYNEFRKKTMGSVILTDTATMSLDSQWHEWASQYPNLFDPDISSTDMPAALMDVFDSLRNMTETDVYGYDRELFGQELLSRVYDSYWNVSTLYTVADKAQKEINKLKFDHAGRMATLKQYHKEQTAKLKQEHREDLQRVRQELREKAEKQRQEIMDRYQESRKKNSENRHKTEMRRKIRKTIMDLKKILNKGDKKRNVKEDMQDLVAQALRSADILFTDNYSNEDMVRYGVGTEMTEQEAKYMAEAQNILAEIEATTTSQERQEAENRLQGKLDYRMGKLKDVFVREKARLNRATVAEVLGSLADAYASLENSEQDYVKGAFDENVYQYLTALKGDVGGTTVKDMSLYQLEELHRAYTMVLTTVRNANKMFAANLKQTREQLGSQVIGEVKQAGGEHGLWSPIEDKISAFSWNNEKPIYAFERIGSATLTKLFENTRAGEDGWYRDMRDAREFYLEQTKKHKYYSWDFEKQHKFTSTSGIDFSLNLEQIMSLYAYSKREQAHDHLMKGGFVFDGNTEVQVNKMGIKMTYLNKTAKAHNISPEVMGQIVGKLTAEQKAFVDEMQDYLSTTMGEKGNEVSMQLYGVKMFKEKHYFPLRSAGQYMERAKEADLKKQQGQISIVNSGFTKATTPKSSNPVVLSEFMDVWADHVNEMSMYHSFVLPMEDFRRVYNYASPNMETGQSVSVNSVIQDAYGEAATGYIDQLYRDLNGGAVSDPRENSIKSLVGKFKKAAVFTSLSVVIQQPSAIGRAFAIIDPKYFIGSKVDSKRHKALWAELKQYAPVAGIKEMGYFDTGMGKSAQDFIKGKEYHGLKEKAAALFTDGDYRDEVLSKAPALADELTWCAIWEAAKRETKAKNPKMDVKSEEFLQLAGKRFTEVITKTQVYDSVLSRSANMRSKGAFMSMWTAFMAESTTTINMVEDALRKAKKGDKKYAARAMGAVMSSIVFNSLRSSLVYAMRDDDEDETFLEKYTQSFATEILDGINPVTYYPFLKDVWSALQGFDIERSDMSLITSLTEKITKLVKVYAKDAESRNEGELADAWWGVVDYATALAGIPVKNVRRDINGAINTYKTISKDLTDRDTSWGSLIDQTWDEVKNSLPVVGWFPDKTAADKLYKATVSGDTAYQKRLASSYKTENSLNSAIRKGLRDNDSRIWEAAVAWNRNDLESYKRIAKQIVAEGHFSQDNVVLAIQAEADAMMPKESTSGSASKAKGYFTADKFAVAISQGNGTMADTIKADIIDTAMANGKTAQEAEESFKSSANSSMKELFLEGEITRAQASNALVDYFGISEEDAGEDVQYWTFQKEYPEYDLAESAVTKYYEHAETAGIGVDVYYEYCQKKSGYSLKADIMDVINTMSITSAQKDALYYANGWAESKIHEAPWH